MAPVSPEKQDPESLPQEEVAKKPSRLEILKPYISAFMIAYDLYSFISDIQFFNLFSNVRSEGCYPDRSLIENFQTGLMNDAVGSTYSLTISLNFFAIVLGVLTWFHDWYRIISAARKSHGFIMPRLRAIYLDTQERQKHIGLNIYSLVVLMKFGKDFLSSLAILLALSGIPISLGIIQYLVKAYIQVTLNMCTVFIPLTLQVILNHCCFVYIEENQKKKIDILSTTRYKLFYRTICFLTLAANIGTSIMYFYSDPQFLIEATFNRIIVAGVCQRNPSGLQYNWPCPSVCSYVQDPHSMSPTQFSSVQKINSDFGFDLQNKTTSNDFSEFLKVSTICDYADYNQSYPSFNVPITAYPKKYFSSSLYSEWDDTDHQIKYQGFQKIVNQDLNVLNSYISPFSGNFFYNTAYYLAVPYLKAYQASKEKFNVKMDNYQQSVKTCAFAFPESANWGSRATVQQTIANATQYQGNVLCVDASLKIRPFLHLLFSILLSLINCSEIVNLNVGGKLFTTYRSTLEKAGPDTYFYKLFNSEMSRKILDDNGNIFLDHDPETFGLLLNLLRGYDVLKGKTQNELTMLYHDANFFGLTDLMERIEQLPDEYVNTENYRGGMKRKEKHGYGYEKNAEGFYVGDFFNGKKHGQGDFIYKNGDKYFGLFKDDQYLKGRLESNEGHIYEGEYLNDRRHGKGKYIWPDDKIYDGEWKDGKVNGYGVYQTKDYIYEGEQKDGKFHGKGKLSYKNGEILDGNWKNNIFNGQ